MQILQFLSNCEYAHTYLVHIMQSVLGATLGHYNDWALWNSMKGVSVKLHFPQHNEHRLLTLNLASVCEVKGL